MNKYLSGTTVVFTLLLSQLQGGPIGKQVEKKIFQSPSERDHEFGDGENFPRTECTAIDSTLQKTSSYNQEKKQTELEQLAPPLDADLAKAASIIQRWQEQITQCSSFSFNDKNKNVLDRLTILQKILEDFWHKRKGALLIDSFQTPAEKEKFLNITINHQKYISSLVKYILLIEKEKKKLVQEQYLICIADRLSQLNDPSLLFKNPNFLMDGFSLLPSSFQNNFPHRPDNDDGSDFDLGFDFNNPTDPLNQGDTVTKKTGNFEGGHSITSVNPDSWPSLPSNARRSTKRQAESQIIPTDLNESPFSNEKIEDFTFEKESFDPTLEVREGFWESDPEVSASENEIKAEPNKRVKIVKLDPEIRAAILKKVMELPSGETGSLDQKLTLITQLLRAQGLSEGESKNHAINIVTEGEGRIVCARLFKEDPKNRNKVKDRKPIEDALYKNLRAFGFSSIDAKLKMSAIATAIMEEFFSSTINEQISPETKNLRDRFQRESKQLGSNLARQTIIEEELRLIAPKIKDQWRGTRDQCRSKLLSEACPILKKLGVEKRREAEFIANPIATKILNEVWPKKSERTLSQEELDDFKNAQQPKINEAGEKIAGLDPWNAILKAAERAAERAYLNGEQRPQTREELTADNSYHDLRTELLSAAYHVIKASKMATPDEAKIEGALIVTRVIEKFLPKKKEKISEEVMKDFYESQKEKVNNKGKLIPGLSVIDATLFAARKAAERAVTNEDAAKMKTAQLRGKLESAAYHAIRNCKSIIDRLQIKNEAQKIATTVRKELLKPSDQI
ncbi:MAG: hypothetical protein K2W97_01415 [Chthoniobacterales bacterium]|nr:hypothetical protein [Chthoniobacterales bacterium]